MKIAKLMTRDVKSCRPGESLETAARTMWDHDCGVVPVVDDDRRVVGILTDRDVCMAAYFQGRPLAQISVESAMSRDIETCGEEDDVETAEERMQHRQVRRLPIVDAAGRLCGILSLNDLAIDAARRTKGKAKAQGNGTASVARVLAAVCAHRETSQQEALAAH